MGIRWTEEQYEEYIRVTKRKGHISRNTPQRVIAGGYSSRWQGRVQLGDKIFHAKSKYERDFALFLEYQRNQGIVESWEYEPRVFKFNEWYSRGATQYTPDFFVVYADKTTEWIEVKGYLNSVSKTKIKRFHKHYPSQGQIKLIQAHWFKKHYKLIHSLPGYMSLEALIASKPRKKPKERKL